MLRILRSPVSVYDGDCPSIKSSQCLFPSLVEMDDGTLVCSFTIGEDMDSVDSITYTSRSSDGGETWSRPVPVFPDFLEKRHSETVKLTYLGGTRLAALGYAFDRSDPNQALANAQTGGLMDDRIVLARSEDGGLHWSSPSTIDCAWGTHVEASAALTVMPDGSWAAPITGFPGWEGGYTSRNCGRILRSFDQGKSWSDDVICTAFEGDRMTCYEQRMCVTESGAIVVISWNEDTVDGSLHCNHFTCSTDNGRHFSQPLSTGIRGQASFVMSLGGERILALHSMRKDTDRPGVLACVIDFSQREWKIVDRQLIWQPEMPIVRNEQAAEIFAYLKFGQPSALRLKNGDLMMIHWAKEKKFEVLATRLRLEER